MLELAGALLVVPSVAISVWERFVSRLTPYAWPIYRLTGIVGTPVHELSHVLACLVFGLRIKQVVLYSTRLGNGLLGYVDFSFDPRSVRNVVGLGIQGIAPLLASGAIATVCLDVGRDMGTPDQGVAGMMRWCLTLGSEVVPALISMANSGLLGLLGSLGLLLICMHGIPSWADIKVGLRGLLMMALILPVVLLVQEAAQAADVPMARELVRWMQMTGGEVERLLWWGLHGAVVTVTIAMLGSIVFVLIPAGIIRCVRRR